MNLIFDLDDTLYNLMGPFELVHNKLYADKTDADCTELFIQSRVYSDEIMEAEKKGLVPHEDCFYLRVKRTYHDVGIEMSRQDAEQFEKLYRAFQKEISLGNGVAEILDYCKEKDIFIAILTNGRPGPQEAKIDALGLHRWFDDEHIFISGSIGYQKPDPMAFKYVENAFELNPEETWYIGDTYEADIIGASGAGWNTVWFNHRNKKSPKENRAKVIVKSIAELRKFVENNAF
nr:HAD family hydrolase [uncultured Anaerobutyricum sp.]